MAPLLDDVHDRDSTRFSASSAASAGNWSQRWVVERMVVCRREKTAARAISQFQLVTDGRFLAASFRIQ
jgi:hypothetical protein